MPMPAAAQSPATAACRQRPPSPVIALAPLGRSHLDGRHPPHHSCNLPSRASSARQPAAPPCDPARLSNPHRPGARRTVLPSLPAVSSLGGFRTPAASARGKACERPASENLHRLGPVAIATECPLCPQLQTYRNIVRMDAKCHFRTHAVQQTGSFIRSPRRQERADLAGF